MSLSILDTFLDRILSWMILMYMASCSSRGEVEMTVASGFRSMSASARGSNFRSPFLMGVSLFSSPSAYSTPAKARWNLPSQ